MSFAVAFSHGQHAFIACDSLMMRPRLGDEGRIKVLATGLVIDDRHQPNLMFEQYALKMVNWTGVCLAFCGHLGKMNEVIRAFDRRVEVQASFTTESFDEYIKADLIPGLRSEGHLEAVGLVVAGGECMKVWIDFQTGDFRGTFDPAPILAIGSGQSIAVDLANQVRKEMFVGAHPDYILGYFSDYFLIRQIQQDTNYTIAQGVGGYVCAAYFNGSNIDFLSPRVTVVLQCLTQQISDPYMISVHRIVYFKRALFAARYDATRSTGNFEFVDHSNILSRPLDEIDYREKIISFHAPLISVVVQFPQQVLKFFSVRDVDTRQYIQFRAEYKLTSKGAEPPEITEFRPWFKWDNLGDLLFRLFEKYEPERLPSPSPLPTT